METNRRSPFGIQLRQFREAAGLSQEQLAERAGLSSRGISDLERGLRTTPRLETVRMLADGLGLNDAQRGELSASRNSSNDIRLHQITHRSSALPVPPTSFIGRVDEVDAVVNIFTTERPRLLTLTGPGGVGKTRIAIEAARQLAGAVVDEAIFVDLSPVQQPDHVIGAIADRLGVPGQRDMQIRDVLAVALQGRSMLMVLDNLEQVIDAATDIAWLLAACPDLTILATSRVLLRIGAEHILLIDPMTLPAGDDVNSLEQSESVSLFVARAFAADHEFTLNQENATAVAAVVKRLQGMPLAIELAAARLRLLTMKELLNRLDSQLPMLAGGARDLPDRHRTMRDTIQWSYDLLTPAEQAVFRTLAIFPAGCTLDAAIAVLRVDDCMPEAESVAALESLVDSSLLRRREGSDGRTRYAMLQTLQEFGLERLALAGEEIVVRRAACNAWSLPLVYESEFVLSTPNPELWLDQIGAEYQNLRAQVSWLVEQDNVEDALDIAMALSTFSSIRGHLEDGRQLLEQLLSHVRLQHATIGRMRGLIALGIVCKYQADASRSLVVLAESARLASELNQLRHIPFALYNLGIAMADTGRMDEAEALFHEAVTAGKETTNTFIDAAAHRKLARIAEYRGQFVRSHRLALESLNLSRSEGHTLNAALAALLIGEQLVLKGDLDQAERRILEAKSLLDQVGNRALTPYVLATLANIYIHRQDLDRAEDLLLEALDMARDLGIIREMGFLNGELARVALLKGNTGMAKEDAVTAIE